MKKTIEEFKGVIPAVLSVFDEQENLNDSWTREFIRFLMSFPIGGLYLTGSTGETFLMDGEERMHQVEVVMDEVGDRVPVVVHVGAMSTRASVKLAQQAAAVGAAGVSSVPPFYFKYTNDQIYGYYRDIAEATDLPMIVYNIPLAGMMTVDMIQRLSEIDNVKGVKYTGTAIYEVTQIKDRCKDGFRVYGGCDELASSNIALGVDGIIGSFYNVIPDLFARIWEVVKSGRIEEATRLQQGALHIISTGLGSGSIMACLKLWLRTAGVPAGYARRPFTNFSEADGERLIGELLRIDREEELGLTIASRIRERKA